MKYYVLAFIFNKSRDKVLLIEKLRPSWQAGKWNGIGGKIKDDDPTSKSAMQRESREEISCLYHFEYALTFVCGSGTVFVYRAFSDDDEIHFAQIEDETLKIWPVNSLPDKIMANCRWMIPICLFNDIKYPITILQDDYGTY